MTLRSRLRPSKTEYVPTTHDQIAQIFNAIKDEIKEDDFFYDFGAGDGRVLNRAMGYCSRAEGMEESEEVFIEAVHYLHEEVTITKGDMLKDPFPTDITIAFMNIVTYDELDPLLVRIFKDCPKIRLLITALPVFDFMDKLVTIVKPPPLPGHTLVVYGDWDLIKNSTLDEMRRDTLRNIYGKLEDSTAPEADESFYIYKVS